MAYFSTSTGYTSAAGTQQDFVSSDTAALASHMSHCAVSRSRFFNLHAAVESFKGLLFSRMVTAALLVVVLAGATTLA